MAVTARIDLGATADLEALVDQLEMVGERVGTRSLVLVGYSEDPRVRELMRDLAGLVPLDLLDVLAVCEDRWWSVCCDGPCCPPDGPAVRHRQSSARRRSRRGRDLGILDPGGDRRPDGRPAAADVDRLDAGWPRSGPNRLGGLSQRRRRKRMKQVVNRALAAGGASEAEAVQISVLARDLLVRDEAWALMSRARAEEHVALWRRVVSWPSGRTRRLRSACWRSQAG